ncbi:MAG: hypothetical protein ACI8QC_001547 [Planctomycetota bacterium]|jgi:hypothetical protein
MSCLTVSLLSLALLLQPAPSAGHDQLPLRACALSPSPGATVWSMDLAAVAYLASSESDSLVVALPVAGADAVMHLRRLPSEQLALPWSIDGRAEPLLLEDSWLSCWVGSVDRDPSSSVQLSFSRFGCFGSVQAARQRWELDGLRGPDQVRWRVADEAPRASCAITGAITGAALGASTRSSNTTSGPRVCGPREARLAVEADGALQTALGSIDAQAAYMAGLLVHAAHVLERDANIALLVTQVALHSPASDPWELPPGADCQDALQALHSAWPAGPPADSDLLYLFSGADLGCSIGDQGLSTLGSFGVLGNLTGQATFPPSSGPFLWDFFALCHTLGHNFGALHTHEYCPPLDQCAPFQLFGTCQQTRDCGTRGSLMSFCHLCPGGVSNIGIGYHPVVADYMQHLASEQLPPYLALELELPVRVLPGEPMSIRLGTPRAQAAAPRVRFRYGSAQPWLERPLLPQTNQHWVTQLPPAQCGQQFQYYFLLEDSNCGQLTWPVAGATSPLTTQVEQLEPYWSTDFEQGDQGWFAVNLGASTGTWERCIPLPADPSWPFAPSAAASGTWCWLTDNSPAHVDVDGGAVGLESAPFNMPEGPFAFSYRAYLGISNPAPGDHLSVWVMGPGSNGEWTQVAEHQEPATHSTDWRTHTVSAEHLGALGLNGGPGLRLRFVGHDGSPPSVVELGLDDIRVWAQACTR